MTSPQAGHIDTAMTNVSVMYRNQKFVAESIFPVLPVEKQSDKYYIYGLDNLRPSDDLRRPAAMSKQLEWTLATGGPYFCDGHALHDWISDEARQNQDKALDLDTDTTIGLTDAIYLNREVNLEATLAANMSPTDLSASSYAGAWDQSGVDPIGVVDTAKETIITGTGQVPNVFFASRPVFRALRNNPNVKARITGAADLPASKITPQMLAEALDVEEVIVGNGIKLTSKKGQTNAAGFIWKKDALLFYRPPTPGLRTVALGYQMTWQTGNLGSLVFRDRNNRRHADWLEVHRYYDERIISAAAGVMWTNATQN